MPLIEAFYKRVPVVAYGATAIPATMDGGGVLHESRDPLHVARIIEAIMDDRQVEEAVLASQDAALARLRARDFGGTLLRFVEEVSAHAAARRRRRWRGISGSSSTCSNGSRSCASSARRSYQALPADPSRGRP